MALSLNWAFHLRWVEWCLGVAILGGLAVRTWSLARRGPGFTKFNDRLILATAKAESRFGLLLGLLCGGWFLLALGAKVSQFRALEFNAEDFWLFADMLEQMRHGGFLLTRFAPQALGWVQHGVVHPMLTWAIALPLAWIFGSVGAAILFGPLVFALAAAVFALLCRKTWGAFGALVFAAAFLASSQLGKVLMYDVHPEAAYPLFVFLWAWAFGLGGGRLRIIPLLLVTALGIGIKEDALLVFLPWIIWGLPLRRTGALLSGLVALGVFALQIAAVAHWSSGAWGPHDWQGLSIVIPKGSDLFHGAHWGTQLERTRIVERLVRDNGGLLGCLASFARFLVGRPFLSLVIFAPWVIAQGRFWLCMLPLCAAYSLLGSPALLWNYYSAPFLATFWLSAARDSVPLSKSSSALGRLGWVLGAALLFGSGGIEYFVPRSEIHDLRDQVPKLARCLEHVNGMGMVTAPLLPLIDRDLLWRTSVWTDRIPSTPAEWSRTRYALFTPIIGRFEVPLASAQRLYSELSRDFSWEQWDESCQPVHTTGAPPLVALFVHK